MEHGRPMCHFCRLSRY